MDDAEKFRHYAAECRRLAARTAAQGKAILLQLAHAWMACAEEAERKAKNKKSESRSGNGQH
jgi:2,4-dienoyl-CoA reductase-like NADH-dependent reductase (Old Yellow Enzyme family)